MAIHILQGGGRFSAPDSVNHRFTKHVKGFGCRPLHHWRVGEFAICILVDHHAKRQLCVSQAYEKGMEIFIYAQHDDPDYEHFKKGRLEMLRLVEFLLPGHPCEDEISDAIFREREHYDANEA